MGRVTFLALLGLVITGYYNAAKADDDYDRLTDPPRIIYVQPQRDLMRELDEIYVAKQRTQLQMQLHQQHQQLLRLEGVRETDRRINRLRDKRDQQAIIDVLNKYAETPIE